MVHCISTGAIRAAAGDGVGTGTDVVLVGRGGQVELYIYIIHLNSIDQKNQPSGL